MYWNSSRARLRISFGETNRRRLHVLLRDFGKGSVRKVPPFVIRLVLT